MVIKHFDGKKPCCKCGLLTYAHERRSAGDRLSSYCKPCDNKRKAEKKARRAARAEQYTVGINSSEPVSGTVSPTAEATGVLVWEPRTYTTKGIPVPPVQAAPVQAATAQSDPATDPKILVEMSRLKRQLGEANSRVSALSAHAERLQADLDAQRELAAAISSQATQAGGPDTSNHGQSEPKIARRAKKLRTGAFVALASDWHVEETVTLEATSGVNQYNLTIAEDRIRQFGAGIARLHEFHTNMFDIPHIVLGMMGDFFSGSIHPENVETQALSPIESIAWLNRHIIALIDGILRDTGLTKPGSLIVPFTWGNHGRITKRTHISTNAQNNLEYLIADTVRIRYANDPRVTVLAPKANHVYVDLWDKTLRFTHLDAIKYQGGVGGLTVPLNKAIVAWNRARHADVTCGGHWHQYLALPDAVVNGSLIGYNPYAEWIRASPEKPQQATFMLDAKHGKCLDTAIWID